MDIALVMKSLQKVHHLNSYRNYTIETKMPVIPLEYILDTQAKLLLNDIGLSPNLTGAKNFGETFDIFIG
jgi:hypothetical protein